MKVLTIPIIHFKLFSKVLDVTVIKILKPHHVVSKFTQSDPTKAFH